MMFTPQLTVQQLPIADDPIVKELKQRATALCRSMGLSSEQEQAMEKSKAYLLRWGTEVVAYFVLRTRMYCGHLDELLVLPDALQKGGIAPFVTEIRKIALEEKFNYLTVWSSLDTNVLYEQLGGQLSKVMSKNVGKADATQQVTEYYLTVVDEPWIDLRTAGLVCVDGDNLLLAFSKNKQAWYLPGGKIDAGEDSKQALIREIEEELSLCLQPDRLSFLTHITAPAFGEKKNILMQQACYIYTLKGETLTVANEIGGVQYFSKEEYIQHQIPVPGVLKVFEFLKES